MNIKSLLPRNAHATYKAAYTTFAVRHRCDQSRFCRDLPILGTQIRVTPDRPKLPIHMNSDFSLLPKAKTCFPITADACFI